MKILPLGKKILMEKLHQLTLSLQPDFPNRLVSRGRLAIADDRDRFVNPHQRRHRQDHPEGLVAFAGRRHVADGLAILIKYAPDWWAAGGRPGEKIPRRGIHAAPPSLRP